ncbi:hypothetical protein BGZ60DRAFT_519242 [Tricladium varicosporioides]|nr:hypothetical protein BGZ60DRAFT_519242 [Hymenoscyphus varicosporioides]
MGKFPKLSSQQQLIIHRQFLDAAQDAVEVGDVVEVRKQFQTEHLHQADLDDSLRLALVEGQIKSEIVQCLLELGANPNTISLSWVKEGVPLDVLKGMVRWGYDVKEKAREFLVKNLANRELVEWVLQQGVDPNLNPDHEYYPGSATCDGSNRDDTIEVLNEAAALGCTAIFDLLVNHGADPSRTIALHKVSRCEDPLLVKAMIKHLVEVYHLDINANDLCGGLRSFHGLGDTPCNSGSPLACAVRRGNAAAVEALLKHGADIDNESGLLTRHEPGVLVYGNAKGCLVRVAVNVGSLPIIKCLLEAGADASVGYAQAMRLNRFGIDRKEAINLCQEFNGCLYEGDNGLESGDGDKWGLEIRWGEIIRYRRG